MTIKARAANEITLKSGKNEILLWGAERVESNDPVFRLNARLALENLIDGQPLHCEMLDREKGVYKAQCISRNDVDLALYMIQNGYAIVERSYVYGTVFEEPYINAEIQARMNKKGIWAVPEQHAAAGGLGGGGILSSLIIGFLAVFVVVFVTLGFAVIRGFRQLIEIQTRSVEMLSQERKLRDKERYIVASMLDAELKANKSKVDAFLVIYEELLASLKNTDIEPKYRKTGDMVQQQPALDRSVFDGNTDKIDLLGHNLASEVIHFYARVKNAPEYINLEPDMPLEEAVQIVEKVVNRAKQYDELITRLIDMFAESGVGPRKARSQTQTAPLPKRRF